jgi:hypothetical protein
MAEPHSIPDVECLKESTDAILVAIEGDEYWIPKSQILEESEVQGEGDDGELIITQWIAEQKGLV